MASKSILLLAIMVLSVGVAAVADPPRLPGAAPATFTKKPTAAKAGAADTVRIDFAVDRETDVAVYVEDAQGQIVRHLVAGVLGKHAPEPLKPDALEQSLVWDGKSDDGRQVLGEKTGSPFKVRVALGLKADYAGLAFAEADKTGPNRIEAVMGLAVGPGGRLFVLDRCNGWGWFHGSKAYVYRRDGSYDKTIKPYAPNLPSERIKAFGPFVNSFGAVNPILYRPEGIALYPHDDTPCQPAITPDGRIVLADWLEWSAYGAGPGVLATIDFDGGCPEASYGGPALPAGWADYAYLASSSDGKAVYFSGLGSSKKPRHAVYVAKLPDRGPGEIFFGVADKSGDDKAHLNDPRGLAVDGKGHLLVADFGNNRVVVLNEKDKSVAGEFPVASPSWVAVHPGTGEVYVCSKRTSVIKLSSWQDPKELSQLDASGLLNKIAPVYRPGTILCYALDGSTDKPAIWAGCGTQLVRFEDRGGKFSTSQPADCVPAQSFWPPASDPTGRRVACRIGGSWDSSLHILDEASGKVAVLGREVAGTEGRIHHLGPDGSIYGVDHAAGVIRFDADGKPKPFEATAKDPYLKGRLPAGNTGTTSWERSFWVALNNDIYVRKQGPEYHGQMTVEVYDQAGKFKRTALWTVSDGMYGPRVDARGNIYIMDIIKPVGQPYPEEFKGHLTIGKRTTHWYDWVYGSVIKFGPEGGAIWFAGKYATPADFEGWRVVGGSGISDLKTTGGSLVGTIVKKPAQLAFPTITLNAATQTKISFRIKNNTDGNKATLYYHLVGERYATEASTKAIEIKPASDFAEYTFDLAGEKDWKGSIYNLSLEPTNAVKGSFSIDWIRVGAGDGKEGSLTWDFNAEDSLESKLPATLKKEPVGCTAYMFPPEGTVLQGALWYRPGFGHVGNVNNNDHCHCMGNDFDMDGFGRIFAPDSARFRVGVLDGNGNELLSFGGYGNQDFCGPDSRVLDPATKLLRPRQASDPKDLASPFVGPNCPRIPFGWIVGLAVTDKYAYVDDVINKRVLRVKLSYGVEETAEAK